MAGRARGRAGDADECGQLLILAGMILVMALLVSVFAASELGAQENRLQRGPESPVPEVLREVRLKVAVTMDGLSHSGMSNDTLREQFEATRDDVRRLAERHAASMIIRLADAGDAFLPKHEGNFTSQVAGVWKYDGMLSYNGSRDYSAVRYDDVPDGIVYDGAQGKVRGIIVYVQITDVIARIEETFVAEVN